MDKVIVIGCGVAGWGALRSLARVPGIERIALGASAGEMGWGSRYADVRALCPHPDAEEEAFVRYLMSRARDWEGALLLPAGDAPAAALSRHREVLSRAYRVPMGPWDAVRTFLDKDRLQALAESVGVPMPRSVRVEPGTADLSRLGALTFPVWIKPVRSDRFVRQFGVKGYLAPDGPTLQARLQQLRTAGQALLLQEVVPGPDRLYELTSLYVDGRGQVVARTVRNKFRQHPPHFGVMRVGYSVESNPEAEQLAARLLRAVPGYRGLVSFEFKRDPRDSRLKLIEVNVRVTRSGMLATASGVNFPELMYRELVRGEPLPSVRGRAGVWYIEWIPDLYYTFFHADGRQYTLEEKLRPYLARHKVFGDFDLRDPRPVLRQFLCGARRMGV